MPEACAVISDPPYGMDAKVNYKTRKRTALAECNDFAPIVGDAEPFDPSPWLSYPTVALFGANWYADRLPISGAWIIWDKLDGLTSDRDVGFNDNSDCELIWTNKGKAARIIRHRWMGCMKASEHGERRVHPTQKPVELMVQLINYLTNPGDTVLDPYMGSGATGIACVQTGRNFIGIEIVKDYFDIAQERIKAAQQEMVQAAFAF
jgi:site-specific DNA-methyltransferase (adenine-specific)/modification methylase